MATAKARKSSQTETMLRHWREAVPNDRLAHLVKDATRGLIRALTMRLAEHQVAFGHWAFLRILWETDGLTQRELSLQAGVMEPTTFAAIKAMEKLGYVARKQMPSSRKNVYVFLTPAGRALKEKLVPLAEEVNRIAVRGVGAAENLALDEADAHKREQRVPSTRQMARLLADAGNGTRRARRA
jgi:DNA-binding MarR family transcriptional regulator